MTQTKKPNYKILIKIKVPQVDPIRSHYLAIVYDSKRSRKERYGVVCLAEEYDLNKESLDCWDTLWFSTYRNALCDFEELIEDKIALYHRTINEAKKILNTIQS